MSWNQLSAFSLASFEMNAQLGGTHHYADAVTGVEDQISLSPQAMGMLGVPCRTQTEESAVPVSGSDPHLA
jgi:hypothetical protein